MLILNNYENNDKEKENPFWISFSDLMTGLMLVFIIISLVFISQAQEDTRKTDDKKREIEKLLIDSQNEQGKIEVSKQELG
jgi:hypothetical protein